MQSHPARVAVDAKLDEDTENLGAFRSTKDNSHYTFHAAELATKTHNQEASFSPQKKRAALGDVTNRSLESTARRRSTSGKQGKHADGIRQTRTRTQPSQGGSVAQDALEPRRTRQHGPIRFAQHQQLRREVLPRGVHNIDSLRAVLGCSDYIHSIMTHLRETECKRRPKTDYMECVQLDITVDMRCTLVDWLVEVALEFRVVSDTLFLAITFLDRYLSLVPTERTNLQLVGVTCLLIACKYEEIYAPQVNDFVRITDDSYTRENVITMEEHVLELLDFELTQPTAKTFVRRFVQAAAAGCLPDRRLEHLCSYFVELSLCEYGSLQFLPSQIAAAAVVLAQHCLGSQVWSPTLQHYSQYQPSELQAPVRLLHCVALSAAAQQPSPITTEKFGSSRYQSVSSIPLPQPPLPASLFLAGPQDHIGSNCNSGEI